MDNDNDNNIIEETEKDFVKNFYSPNKHVNEGHLNKAQLLRKGDIFIPLNYIGQVMCILKDLVHNENNVFSPDIRFIVSNEIMLSDDKFFSSNLNMHISEMFTNNDYVFRLKNPRSLEITFQD